jgi:hypothetical protein
LLKGKKEKKELDAMKIEDNWEEVRRHFQRYNRKH